MSARTIPAHFDGERILLDVDVALEPNTRLLVTVLPEQDEERESWLRASLHGLEQAHGDHEPEYGLDSVREENPAYEGR